MQLVMLGAPGTGKGTQGKLLSQNYHIPNISTGEILRSAIAQGSGLGIKAQAYMDRGELVPDAVMIGLIQQRLQDDDCKSGFILDGFPRTVEQALALDEFLEQVKKNLNFVITFELEQNKIVARLTSRRVCQICGKDFNLITNPPPSDNRCPDCQGEIIQRADDTAETVLNRLKVYEEKTKPLKEYFRRKRILKIFDADGSIDEIQERIRSFLVEENR